MAEENRNEVNANVSPQADVLQEIKQLGKENNQNFERIIENFNTCFIAITDKHSS